MLIDIRYAKYLLFPFLAVFYDAKPWMEFPMYPITRISPFIRYCAVEIWIFPILSSSFCNEAYYLSGTNDLYDIVSHKYCYNTYCVNDFLYLLLINLISKPHGMHKIIQLVLC
jgi:hypothetical protein